MSGIIANSRFKGEKQLSMSERSWFKGEIILFMGERQNLWAKEIAYGRNFCGMGGSFSVWAKILTYERF